MAQGTFGGCLSLRVLCWRGFADETCCGEIDAVTEDVLEDGDVGGEGAEVSEEEELGRVRPLPKIAFGDSCCESLRAASG